jgi:hypothetical protein
MKIRTQEFLAGDTPPPARLVSDRWEVSRGLGTDRPTIPTDRSAAAVLHYATPSAGAHVWVVNGAEYTETPVLDSGLWCSELEVEAPDGSVAGEEVRVLIGAETLVLEVD